MKKILLLSSLSLTLTSYAQQLHCGTDEMHQQLFQGHPEYNEGIIRAHQRLQDDTRTYLQIPKTKSDQIYVIPIVFHIIHNNGTENINDSQIHDAVKQINEQFRKQNADTNQTIAAFKGIAADAQIEFRLAQLDPDGNCTSGITRTVSTLTSPGNHDVKALIHWPPHKYLNVYVCAQAAGLAGHALLPAAADTIPQWDGIVIQHSYVGSIGTSSPLKKTVLTHEIGHFFNLQHIWGGNNVPNYYYLPVGQSTNCDFDDEVEDTPNTIGWSSCNLSGETCGSLDNVQNYMDYSYCSTMFTEGQKARMHACLNSSVAGRNNLWQPANLQDTGTDNLTYYLCGANFTSDRTIACVDQDITFEDLSYHGVENRKWICDDAQITNDTAKVTQFRFENPGIYTIKLIVSRGTDTLEVEKTAYIAIHPASALPIYYSEGFESWSNHHYSIEYTENYKTWEVTNEIGRNSTSSIFYENFNHDGGGKKVFITEAFDLSQVSNAVISFDLAYAQINSNNNDLLKVYTSNDCGLTWTVRKNLGGLVALKTVPEPINEYFKPTSEQWKKEQVQLPTAALTSNVRVKFEFTAAGGNNLYIDNIQLAPANQLNLSPITTSAISISPNPSTASVEIYAAEESIEEVQIINTSGQLMKEFSSIDSEFILVDTMDLKPGIYFFIIQTDKQHVTIKHLKK